MAPSCETDLLSYPIYRQGRLFSSQSAGKHRTREITSVIVAFWPTYPCSLLQYRRRTRNYFSAISVLLQCLFLPFTYQKDYFWDSFNVFASSRLLLWTSNFDIADDYQFETWQVLCTSDLACGQSNTIAAASSRLRSFLRLGPYG